jgi:uncharacterized protein DUF1573
MENRNGQEIMRKIGDESSRRCSGILALAIDCCAFLAMPIAAASQLLRPVLAEGPHLAATEYKHDFGSVIEGTTVRHVFHVSNDGDLDLTISALSPGCGCVYGRLSRKNCDGTIAPYRFGDPIPPGASLDLDAHLASDGKHGAVSARIRLISNDPLGPLDLELIASVDSYFQLEPEQLAFGDLSAVQMTGPVERTCEVTARSGRSFALTLDSQSLQRGVSCAVAPVDPAPDGSALRWRVKASIDPAASEGPILSSITLVSGETIDPVDVPSDRRPRRYSMRLLMTGAVRGVVSCDPSYISFGLIRPGQTLIRSVRVQCFDPSFHLEAPTFLLTGPSDRSGGFLFKDHFSTRVRRLADADGVEVDVVVDPLPEGSSGIIQGSLLIQTGHPRVPEIKVNFSGVCRPTQKQ